MLGVRFTLMQMSLYLNTHPKPIRSSVGCVDSSSRLPMTIILFLLLSLLLPGFAQANPATNNVIDSDSDFQLVNLVYYTDTSNELTIEQIRNDASLSWQPKREEYIDFGYQSAAIWYRFDLTNEQSVPLSRLISLEFSMLDYVDVYRFSGDRLIGSTHTGDRVPFYQRDIVHPDFLFALTLKANEQQSIFIRVQTQGSHIVPLKVWDLTAHSEYSNRAAVFHGLYFGGISIVVLLYFLIYLGLRERVYIYYCFTLLSVLLYAALTRGLLYPLIFSSSPDFHHNMLVPTITGCGIFGALFATEFLALKSHSKFLHYLCLSIVAVLGATILLVPFLGFQTWLKAVMAAGFYGAVTFLVLGPSAWVKGCPNGTFYTLGVTSFMLVLSAAALSRYGIVPVSFVTEHSMQIGSSIEAFFFTVALSYRVYREHQDKIEAQTAQLNENAERIKVETELLQKSLTHPVTLMPNRTSFEEQVQRVIAERNTSDTVTRLAVILVEVRRFDEITKTLGHQNADSLLRELAQIWQQRLSQIDGVIPVSGPLFDAYLCSLENASFGVLMDADIVDKTPQIMKKLVAHMREPIEFNGMHLELNAVAGVAISPEHGLNAATLMRHAGVAVDSSDAQDRRIALFNPEQDLYNTRRLTMITELKQAIEDDALELFLQPKYHPESDKVVGAEALLRWQHKLYGTIRPDEFIPMAEQTGIIRSLTRWVFRRALEQQQILKAKGHELSISINLSAANLRESDLISFFATELTKHDTKPETIYLELTETAMMKNPEAALKTLSQIRELGFKVSVDDFGAGYSSLAYLKTLPANEIKIDRALVMGIDTSEGDDTVIRSTINMCHELGFSVVAEGVETLSMLNELCDLRCDLIQGYLFTAPLPLDQFINWLGSYQLNRRVV